MKHTLFAFLFTMAAFFCVTSVTAAAFIETEGGLGIGPLIVAGAFAVWIAMAICRIAFPRHSRGALAMFVAFGLVAMLIISRSAVATITHVPAIAITILSLVHAIKKSMRTRKTASLGD